MAPAQLLLLLVLALQQSQPVQLLFVSDFYANQVTDARTGQVWFGLFPEAGGWKLGATTLRVDSISSGCMQNGRRVTIDRQQDPLLLVRGIPSLRAGSVDAVPIKSSVLSPDSTREFRFGSSVFYLAATGGDTSYSVRLIGPAGRSQELVAYHGRAPIAWPAKILWIGDLDRDGKPDLFLDIALAEIPPADRTLFLSTAAGPSEYVGKVAEFRTLVC